MFGLKLNTILDNLAGDGLVRSSVVDGGPALKQYFLSCFVPAGFHHFFSPHEGNSFQEIVSSG